MSSPYPPQYDPYGQQQPPNFPSPGGYYIPPGGDPRYGIRPPETSPLAIMSMIGGIVSLLVSWMTCCCFFSPFVFTASLASIVMGHVALTQIHRSMGAIGGREMAFVGLFTGYPAAVVSGFFLMLLAWSMATSSMAPPAAPPPPVATTPAGEAQLDVAEKKIAAADFGTSHGNSPVAIAFAEQFNKLLRARRDELAQEKPSLGIVAEQDFVTWCEVRKGRCAFITQVHRYDDYSFEGKAQLDKLAWKTAQEVVRGIVAEDVDLAVGTKGEKFWGNIMLGETVAEGSSDTGLNTQTEDYELLYSFFTPTNAAELDEGLPPIKLPDEAD